jgi:hypothetical protein
MKQHKTNPKREYLAALAYYKRTVWNHACGVRLAGLQYDVALRAWHRLHNAHYYWFCSLNDDKQREFRATDSEIEELHPLRLEHDDSINPELLATVASARLGTPKLKSVRNAVAEAHRILMASRDYLKELPALKNKLKADMDAYWGTVPFGDILDSSGKPDHVPLLPTVQTKRNNGKLSPRALEQALKRHANCASKKIQQEIREALKNKAISCRLLEEIRWQRFRRHFKG